MTESTHADKAGAASHHHQVAEQRPVYVPKLVPAGRLIETVLEA